MLRIFIYIIPFLYCFCSSPSKKDISNIETFINLFASYHDRKSIKMNIPKDKDTNMYYIFFKIHKNIYFDLNEWRSFIQKNIAI